MYYNKSNQRLLAEELGRKIKPDSKWGDFCAGGASTSRPPQDRSRTAPPTPDEYQAYQWLLERDDALGAIAAASETVAHILREYCALSSILGLCFPNANAMHKAIHAVFVAIGKSEPKQVDNAEARVVYEWSRLLICVVNDINGEVRKAEKEFGEVMLGGEFSRYGELSESLEKSRGLALLAEPSPYPSRDRGNLIRWMRTDGEELCRMFIEFHGQKPRIRRKHPLRLGWRKIVSWAVFVSTIVARIFVGH